MNDPLEKLKSLASNLPKGLRSDWENTNHFELTCEGKEYWWLLLADSAEVFGESPMETEPGKRLGLLMDIASEVARLRDSGLL